MYSYALKILIDLVVDDDRFLGGYFFLFFFLKSFHFKDGNVEIKGIYQKPCYRANTIEYEGGFWCFTEFGGSPIECL